VLDKLLESVIIDKNIIADDMLDCDRNAAFLAIRRVAYGDEYSVSNFMCPRCGKDNELKIDLGKMDNKPLNVDNHSKGKNEFNFVLPVTKKTITYKLLTKRDEDAIDAEVKALKKVSKDVTSDVTTRLKYMIIGVDGDMTPVTIRTFVDRLPAKDSLDFRKHLKATSPNVDMTFDFCCAICGSESREVMPLNQSFFWPNE
jgi:hypothetical protein